MPRNGSGTSSVINTFVIDTVADPDEVNANFTDVADQLTNSLPRDGQAGMNAPLPLQNGTAALPALTFTSDPDTGIYRVSANKLGLALGGTGYPLDAGVVYAAKAGSYTALGTDNNAVHRYTAAATVTLTAAATLATNWHYTVIADGGAVTIDPNSAELINGAATLVLQSGQAAFIICDGSAFRAVVYGNPQAGVASVASCRLTLESGVAISTTDQLAKTAVFLTPYLGNQIGLYVNGGWIARSFVETTLSLSGFTSGKPFDIFAYDNSGTLALEALVWTNDTTRATAIAFQDGVPVKSGDTTRRLVGTIYTSATGQTQIKFGSAASGGDPAYIGIDNVYNRTHASVFVADTTASWAKASGGSIEALNSSNGNRVSFIRALPGDKVESLLTTRVNTAVGGIGSVGFGLDSTTVYNARCINPTVGTNLTSNVFISTQANYSGYPGVGFHYLQALQFSATAATTFHGASNQTGFTAQLDY
jgi:hypothetical protein